MKTLLRLIFLIILAGNLSDFPASSAQKSWTVVQSPTRNKIAFIIAFNNGKAIAASNNLYLFDNNRWTVYPVQPPVSEISRLFALSENHIWITQFIPSNESEFFLSRDHKWEKLKYPLANTIQSIHLNEKNEGWFCGDREIAYQEAEKYYYIPYPLTYDGAIKCFGTDKNNLWIKTLADKLFYYNGKQWTESFPGRIVRCMYFIDNKNGYVVVDNSLYQYKNGSWKLHSESDLLKNIRNIVYSDNEFWGIGEDGLLIHYKDYWYRVKLPVKVDLYDISFSDNGVGWIVGDKGVILKYSSGGHENIVSRPGFDRVKIINVSKEINDEYGVVMEDFDNNGFKDIYATCIFEQSRIYMNYFSGNKLKFSEEGVNKNATGRIEDRKNVSFSEIFLGAGSGDIDNDGDQDLYLCSLIDKNKLLLNDGTGSFRDVSLQKDRASDQVDRTNSAAFSDVDNDGDLDLFVANEYSTNRLYLNNGYGYFKEVTEKAGLTTPYGGMCGIFGDIDNDNDPDLLVVNWARPNILYENISTKNSGVKFKNISRYAGIDRDSIKKSNAAVFADFDNDGDLDIFITNRRLSNRLYRNEGGNRFTDVTEKLLGIDSMYSYGTNFADFDNDGYLDLFVANVGENRLFKNVGGKKFVDVTQDYGVELKGYSTGSCTGDIDNDGDIDLYVANYINDNSMLFLNNINDSEYINIKIDGILSNKDAVGAKVWIYPSGKIEKKFLLGFREISGGSGYSSKDSREVHFGVNEGFYDIVVVFPSSGIQKVLTKVKNGSFIKVKEFEGFYSYFYPGLDAVKLFLFNRENQKEIFKFVVALLFVSISYKYGLKRYRWKLKYFGIIGMSVLAVYLVQIRLFRYESLFYSSVIPLSTIVVILILVHIGFERRLMKDRLLLEKQKTRDALARDLHDDLASTISSALIYTDIIGSSELPEKSKNLLVKVHNLLKEAAASVTDIIWTVSPRHDRLEDLITRLQLLMNDLCRVNSIEFQTNFEADDSDIIITDAARRNIYLIYKEAINNVIKHSSATKVEFNVHFENDILTFTLSDNGIGINNLSEADNIIKNPGHGLRNIKARAGEIDAQLEIKSENKNGTYIILKQKIT